MGEGHPIYHADRLIAETGEPLGDGTHIIYVNGAYRDDSAIGKLMHDFSCREPDHMHYRPLAEQVRYYKEDVKGVETMCRIVEELIDREKAEMIVKMKKTGKLSNEDIAEITGFTIAEVEAIEEKDTAAAY